MGRKRDTESSGAWERLDAQAKRKAPAPPELLAAARDGDLRAIDRLLAAGVPVDLRTENDPGSIFFEGGETALMRAAGAGEIAAVELLLGAGADVNAVADDGTTPLTRAVGSGSLVLVKLLLDRGAELRPPQSLFTPLHGAARRGDAALVELLLERGAAVDEPIWTGTTPLMAAADAGDVRMVELLLEAGANVDRQDEAGNTALHLLAATKLDDLDGLLRHEPALLERLRATATALLGAGASPDLANREGDTPLTIVCERYEDLLDLTRLLSSAGARIRPGMLVRAVSMRAALVTGCLLDAGANVDEPDSDGRTALVAAAENGYEELVLLLIGCGATGIEAARAAARARDRADVETLLDAPDSRPLALPSSSTHVLARAGSAFSEGDYARARASYEWLPRVLRDRIPGVLSNIAQCHQREGNHEEALQYFELVVARDPSMAHAWRAACFSAYTTGRWPEMLRFAEGATNVAPRDGYAWQQLAIAASQLADHGAAVRAGRRAMELDPNNAYAACNLAGSLREIGDLDWVPMLERALTLDPSLSAHVGELLEDPAFAKRAKPETRTKPKRKPLQKSKRGRS